MNVSNSYSNAYSIQLHIFEKNIENTLLEMKLLGKLDQTQEGVKGTQTCLITGDLQIQAQIKKFYSLLEEMSRLALLIRLIEKASLECSILKLKIKELSLIEFHLVKILQESASVEEFNFMMNLLEKLFSPEVLLGRDFLEKDLFEKGLLGNIQLEKSDYNSLVSSYSFMDIRKLLNYKITLTRQETYTSLSLKLFPDIFMSFLMTHGHRLYEFYSYLEESRLMPYLSLLAEIVGISKAFWFDFEIAESSKQTKRIKGNIPPKDYSPQFLCTFADGCWIREDLYICGFVERLLGKVGFNVIDSMIVLSKAYPVHPNPLQGLGSLATQKIPNLIKLVLCGIRLDESFLELMKRRRTMYFLGINDCDFSTYQNILLNGNQEKWFQAKIFHIELNRSLNPFHLSSCTTLQQLFISYRRSDLNENENLVFHMNLSRSLGLTRM